jgi:hypothetical protein
MIVNQSAVTPGGVRSARERKASDVSVRTIYRDRRRIRDDSCNQGGYPIGEGRSFLAIVLDRAPKLCILYIRAKSRRHLY